MQLRSVVLGFGIGVMLTSLVSIVFISGLTTGIQSDKVKSSSTPIPVATSIVVDAGVPEATTMPTPTLKPTITPSPAPQAQATTQTMVQASPTSKPDEYAVVRVNLNDSSEVVAKKLAESGLAEQNAFLASIKSEGLVSEINVGEFRIRKGSSVREIIRILTGK